MRLNHQMLLITALPWLGLLPSISTFGQSASNTPTRTAPKLASPQIEFQLSSKQKGADCARKKEYQSFLSYLGAFEGLISDFEISAPRSSNTQCLEKIKSDLTKKGFRVIINQDDGVKSIIVRAGFGSSNGTQQTSSPTGAQNPTDKILVGKNDQIVTLGKDKNLTAVLPKKQVEGTQDLPKDANGETKTLEDGEKTPEKDTAADNAKDTSGGDAEKSVADNQNASNNPADPFNLNKPAPPKIDDEIARWHLAWNPSYKTVSGSGLAGSSAGLNVGSFSGSFLYSTKYEASADFSLPLSASSTLPSALFFHGQIAKYVTGERKGYKLKEAPAKTEFMTLAGVIFLTQDPPTQSSAQSAKLSLALLAELGAGYVGVKGRRLFKDNTALRYEYHLVPVLPLTNNAFSLCHELKFGIEKSYETYDAALLINYGSYDVRDNDLGDLHALYEGVELSVIFPF